MSIHETIAEVDMRPSGRRLDWSADSFEEFVQATSDRMYRSALVLTAGDHQLAEDLTQATYTRVYVAWARISVTDHPLAFTRKVLLRSFLSHRRLRRSGERPLAQLPDADAGHDPDHAARLDLLAAVGRLPPRDRTVLMLRYWEDLSIASTAEILGIRESTCRTRTTRALARLRAQLPDLIHPSDHAEDQP